MNNKQIPYPNTHSKVGVAQESKSNCFDCCITFNSMNASQASGSFLVQEIFLMGRRRGVVRRYQPDGSVAAVVDVAHHRGGSHLRAQVVVCVNRQPEVAVHQSCEGQSLPLGGHLQLLGRKKKEKKRKKERDEMRRGGD